MHLIHLNFAFLNFTYNFHTLSVHANQRLLLVYGLRQLIYLTFKWLKWYRNALANIHINILPILVNLNSRVSVLLHYTPPQSEQAM